MDLLNSYRSSGQNIQTVYMKLCPVACERNLNFYRCVILDSHRYDYDD
jgi:hypothetical protein